MLRQDAFPRRKICKNAFTAAAGRGSARDPAGELTALLRPLLDLRGTSKERAREERYRKGVGEEREDRAEEGRGEGREKGEEKGKWGTEEGNGHTGTSFSPLRALVRV